MFVGIDTGLHGAIAYVAADGGLYGLEDMPLAEDAQGKSILAVGRLATLLAHKHSPEYIYIIEKTQPLPVFLRGSIASYEMGFHKGVFQGILESMHAYYQMVSPQAWQTYLGFIKVKKDKKDPKKKPEITTKTQALKLADTIFPLAPMRTPKGRVYDGRVDALLIAEYGRRGWLAQARESAGAGQCKLV